MTKNSYDQLAPYYRALSEQRAAYLTAVEAYVVQMTNTQVYRMLDVGSGDGVRARRLSSILGVQELFLAEPSEGMVALARCRSGERETIWPFPVEGLPLDSGTFDLITCLWNVLGHVPGESARVAGLQRMAALLSPGGRVVMDVNNRHNSAAYGRWRVQLRKLLDLIYSDARRGDVAVTWQVGDSVISGTGHLFTPAEVRKLVRSAGLCVIDEIAIDYANGRRSRQLTEGQLVYTLEKAHA